MKIIDKSFINSWGNSGEENRKTNNFNYLLSQSNFAIDI